MDDAKKKKLIDFAFSEHEDFIILSKMHEAKLIDDYEHKVLCLLQNQYQQYKKQPYLYPTMADYQVKKMIAWTDFKQAVDSVLLDNKSKKELLSMICENNCLHRSIKELNGLEVKKLKEFATFLLTHYRRKGYL